MSLLTSQNNMKFPLFSCVCTLQVGVHCYQALSHSWPECVFRLFEPLSLKRNPISSVTSHTAVIFQFVNILLITSFSDMTFEVRCCTKPFDTGKSLQDAAGLLPTVQTANTIH